MSNRFQFKQFSIIQDINSHKVGSDSMLLGAWCRTKAQNILDIGTGTGILALMLAQKNPEAGVLAIEPDFESLQEAQINFQNSPFHNRIESLCCRLQDFETIKKFDLIICNPPYFEKSLLSENPDKNRVRHTDSLSIQELYKAVSALLTAKGTFNVIFPSDLESLHLATAAGQNLHPAKILRTIREDGTYKRSLVSFCNTKQVPEVTEILVKTKENKYNQEYIQLTRDFYAKDLNISAGEDR